MRLNDGINHGEREFSLSPENYVAVTNLIHEVSGIVLGDAKRDLVYGRLAPRLRELGCRNFTDYLELVHGADGQGEQTAMVNAITTNLTGFFRERHHFEALAADILPRLVREKPDRRLRIWSAGCSSGQEPYSIAMVLHRFLTGFNRWDALILATDIDSNMVAHGQEGVYGSDVAETIPPEYRRYVRHAGAGQVVMQDELKALIRFKRLNLIEPWPMKALFDLIFCRNVVIYFDKNTQRVLFDRYADLLPIGGMLFIGHSESLHRVSSRFRHLGQTIYQKVG